MTLRSAFTIASFNIRNDRAIADGLNHWFFRRRRVVETLRAINADVFGLQEVRPWALRYLEAAFPDYRVVSFGRDNGRSRGEHCSVFVRGDRFDISHKACHWFSPTPAVAGSCDPESRTPRIATIVKLVDKFDGTSLRVVNLHIDAVSPDVRTRSLEQLCGKLNDEPLPSIVLGDFNDLIDEACFAPLKAAGLRDALSAIPSVGPTSATYHGFRGTQDGARIDHILASAEFVVPSAAIVHSREGERLASDHWPIVARLLRNDVTR